MLNVHICFRQACLVVELGRPCLTSCSGLCSRRGARSSKAYDPLYDGGCVSQILSGEQMAQCLVAGYPWWPDTLAIATCVAAEAGEDGAAAALHTHFSRMGLS